MDDFKNSCKGNLLNFLSCCFWGLEVVNIIIVYNWSVGKFGLLDVNIVIIILRVMFLYGIWFVLLCGLSI